MKNLREMTREELISELNDRRAKAGKSLAFGIKSPHDDKLLRTILGRARRNVFQTR